MKFYSTYFFNFQRNKRSREASNEEDDVGGQAEAVANVPAIRVPTVLNEPIYSPEKVPFKRTKLSTVFETTETTRVSEVMSMEDEIPPTGADLDDIRQDDESDDEIPSSQVPLPDTTRKGKGRKTVCNFKASSSQELPKPSNKGRTRKSSASESEVQSKRGLKDTEKVEEHMQANTESGPKEESSRQVPNLNVASGSRMGRSRKSSLPHVDPVASTPEDDNTEAEKEKEQSEMVPESGKRIRKPTAKALQSQENVGRKSRQAKETSDQPEPSEREVPSPAKSPVKGTKRSNRTSKSNEEKGNNADSSTASEDDFIPPTQVGPKKSKKNTSSNKVTNDVETALNVSTEKDDFILPTQKNPTNADNGEEEAVSRRRKRKVKDFDDSVWQTPTPKNRSRVTTPSSSKANSTVGEPDQAHSKSSLDEQAIPSLGAALVSPRGRSNKVVSSKEPEELNISSTMGSPQRERSRTAATSGVTGTSSPQTVTKENTKRATNSANDNSRAKSVSPVKRVQNKSTTRAKSVSPVPIQTPSGPRRVVSPSKTPKAGPSKKSDDSTTKDNLVSVPGPSQTRASPRTRLLTEFATPTTKNSRLPIPGVNFTNTLEQLFRTKELFEAFLCFTVLTS